VPPSPTNRFLRASEMNNDSPLFNSNPVNSSPFHLIKIVALFLLLSVSANAENWYVAPDGSPDNSGTTPKSPWSLDHAVGNNGANLHEGDRVFVLNGTYQNVRIDLEQKRDIRFIGYNGSVKWDFATTSIWKIPALQIAISTKAPMTSAMRISTFAYLWIQGTLRPPQFQRLKIRRCLSSGFVGTLNTKPD